MANNNQLVLSLAVGVAAGAIAATAAPPAVGLAVGSCAFLGAFVLQQGTPVPTPPQQVKAQPEAKKKGKKEKPASKPREEEPEEPEVKVEAPKPKPKAPAPSPKPAPKPAEKPAPAPAKKPQGGAPAPAAAKQAPKPAPAPAKKAQAPAAPAAAAAAAAAKAELSKSAQKRLKLKKKQDAEQAEKSAQLTAENQKRHAEDDEKDKQQAIQDQAIRDKEEGWQTQTSNKKSNSSKPKKDKKDKKVAEEIKQGLVKIPVDAKKHGRIIGTEGSTLQAIQNVTGVKLTMPKPHQGTSVIVEGEPDQIERASQIINDLVTKGYSSAVLQEGHVETSMTIPDGIEGFAGRVLGFKGVNIQAIQKKLKVRVVMPEKDSEDRRMILIGTPGNCELARQTVNQLIHEGFSPVTHEGYIKVEFEIPRPDLPLLIGKKGATIQSIQETTKARVNIPGEHDENQRVVVVGPPAAVLAAEKRIKAVLEPPENQAEEAELDGHWQEGIQEVVF